MIKIVTVIGARPQIIKAAALSRTIKNHFKDKITEYIVHTGQHYDASMSQVFFDELGIPAPHINLNIGSAPHGKQTALMLQGIEEILQKETPDYLVVYGDTNSTLAGAIAASKIHIPIVHIEAGLRSFNKSMPEEINRIMCDHASTLLFVPSLAGIENLKREGFPINAPAPYTADKQGVFHCGDIMFDNLVYYSEIIENKINILNDLNIKSNRFILTTIHRDNNTDIPERFAEIIKALVAVTEKFGLDVVLPLHPRTKNIINTQLSANLYDALMHNPHIRIIPPVSYLEMMMLEKHAHLILTDSGGVQKEAYFFRKPLVIARPETEWVEIVENQCGIIADADANRIIKAITHFINNPQTAFPPIFGNGKAAEFICNKMIA